MRVREAVDELLDMIRPPNAEPLPSERLRPEEDGYDPARDPHVVKIAYYRWCQDILSDMLSIQLQTRPEQIANADKPNAEGVPA